jgi:predicted PurR-regulated permease PerM
MQDVNAQDERRDALLARQARALEELSLRMRPLASLSRLFRVVTIAVAAGLVIATLGQLVMIIFAAVLIATLLRGAGRRLGAWTGIGSGWGMLVVVLAMLAFAGGIGWWRGADLLDQADRLQQLLVDQLAKLHDQLQQSAWGRSLLHDLPFGLGGTGATNSDANSGGSIRAGSLIPRLGGFVFGAVWSAIGVLGTLAIILVTALYIGASPRPYIDGVVSLLPKSKRASAHRILNHVVKTCGAGWWASSSTCSSWDSSLERAWPCSACRSPSSWR